MNESITTKLQKLYSLPRNLRADNKSPVLFSKKRSSTGDLLPTHKIFIERPGVSWRCLELSQIKTPKKPLSSATLLVFFQKNYSSVHHNWLALYHGYCFLSVMCSIAKNSSDFYTMLFTEVLRRLSNNFDWENTYFRLSAERFSKAIFIKTDNCLLITLVLRLNII